MLTDIFTNKHLYLLFLLSSTVTVPTHNKEVSTFNFKKAALVAVTTAVVCGAGVTIYRRHCAAKNRPSRSLTLLDQVGDAPSPLPHLRPLPADLLPPPVILKNELNTRDPDGNTKLTIEYNKYCSRDPGVA